MFKTDVNGNVIPVPGTGPPLDGGILTQFRVSPNGFLFNPFSNP